MTHDETVKLLALIKGNWFKQPTDDLTIRMWQEILGPRMALEDVFPVALNMVREGMRDDPPTPGQLFAHAQQNMAARIRAEQARAALPSPGPKCEPGERRVTPSGEVFVADEHGILRPEKRDTSVTCELWG